MAEQNNQPGAKPAPAAPKQESSQPVVYSSKLSRRDEFVVRISAAILTRQAQRNPVSLAREAVVFTDALLMALDGQ